MHIVDTMPADLTGDKYMSKGSKRRPSEVGEKEIDDNWKKIFGKPKPVVKERKRTPSHGVTKVHRDKTKYGKSDRKRPIEDL